MTVPILTDLQRSQREMIGVLMFVSILLLGPPGCESRRAALLEEHNRTGLAAESAEHGPDGVNRGASSGINAATAWKLATEFASTHLRLPMPVSVSARLAARDEWLVYFLPGQYEGPDGSRVPYIMMANWYVMVLVTRDGRCVQMTDTPKEESEVTPEEREQIILRPVYREGNIVDEASAILLARSYVMRNKLIPPAMVVEERELTSGQWLVSFVPASHAKPTVVLVECDRKCRFFFEADQDPGERLPGPPRPD